MVAAPGWPPREPRDGVAETNDARCAVPGQPVPLRVRVPVSILIRKMPLHPVPSESLNYAPMLAWCVAGGGCHYLLAQCPLPR